MSTRKLRRFPKRPRRTKAIPFLGRIRVVPVLVGLLVIGAGCGKDDGGTKPATDTTAPAAVSDLSVIAVTDSSATLQWTAPGDDGTEGKASQYDVRYATEEITEQNWSQAVAVAGVPSPGIAGSKETFTVAGLDPETVYSFALKTADEVPNWSALSNVASDTTAALTEEPILVLSTTSLDFDSTATERTFTITNGGTGTLTWTVTDDQTWLGVDPDSGSTTTEADEVTVTVDRLGVSPGTYSGTVTVDAGSAGTQAVTVSMSVGTTPPRSTTLSFVTVPHGTFTMGDGVALCGEGEHQVTLTEDFYLGQTEVTNQQYLELLQWAYDNGYVTVVLNTVQDNLDGSTQELLDLARNDGEITCSVGFSDAVFTLRDAGHGINPDHPVKEVTWYGAAAFCDWLSLKEGLPRAYDHSTWECNGGDPYHAVGYRLPTDAEWEYAAQYDDERIYPWGNEAPSPSRCNYERNVGWTTPVGSYPAEKTIGGKGLYDMAGNVWEWCNDWFTWPRDCLLSTAPVTDPLGPASGLDRMIRGGSWSYYCCSDDDLRCALRGWVEPTFGDPCSGFRVARTVNP